MTINHIDQLAEWWENAEEGVIEKGDTVINRSDSETTIYVATVRARRQHPNARILARAPKSHHPFPAILATYRDENGMVSGVWRPEGKPRYWEGPEGDVVHEDSLEDVTPLIEAKVTDAMIDRILDVIDARFDNYPAGIGEDLAVAALGLESV